MRFSPHDPKHPAHRFQYVYAWFFYAIMSLYWMTVRDFKQLAKFRTEKLGNVHNDYRKVLWELISWKTAYYTYILVIPMLVAPGPWYWVPIGWLVMHVVAGSLLSAIFQPAHVMPSSEFPVPSEHGTMENNWAVHQLLTTTNFAPGSRIFSWFVGGLNYQVEHHLFPNICHVHYRHLSPIVRTTAEEYGLPYHSQKTFVRALQEHVRFLRQMGEAETESDLDQEVVAA